MPMFTRGADVAEFPDELSAFLTSHGWKAADEAPSPEPAPVAADVPAPQTPAVPTTAPADDNTGVIND